MPFVTIFLVVFALLVVYLIMQTKRAGPRQLGEMGLSRAIGVAKATAEDPGHGWSGLGSRTTADGLNLKFDHDDDPEAEATFLVDPSKTKQGNMLAHSLTVRLGSEFESHHVHTRGYVFRVRMRGTGPVVGKEVRIQMHVASDGTPYGGRVENDDDTDAAVGGWIEFEEVEVLRAGPR
jgi:hypothetical protein